MTLSANASQDMLVSTARLRYPTHAKTTPVPMEPLVRPSPTMTSTATAPWDSQAHFVIRTLTSVLGTPARMEDLARM